RTVSQAFLFHGRCRRLRAGPRRLRLRAGGARRGRAAVASVLIHVEPSRILGRSPRMDIRKIKKLIELLEESGIAEIEIKEGEEAVRISRMPTGTAAVHAMPTYAMPMAAPVAAPAQAAASAPAAAAAAEAPAAARPRANEHVVTAPMV